MPLAEYLASEQAREDVKALLAKPCPQVMPGDPVGWRHYGIHALPHPAPPSPWMGVAADYGGRAIALPDWRTITAYYSPEGDRYVVTDLGEGWRALRLRGIDWHTNDEIINKVDAVALPLMSPEPGYETSVPWGTLELRYVAAADLPDAICRVMLASLTVAEVGR